MQFLGGWMLVKGCVHDDYVTRSLLCCLYLVTAVALALGVDFVVHYIGQSANFFDVFLSKKQFNMA